MRKSYNLTIQYLSVKGCRDVPWNVSTRVFGSRICLTEQYCLIILTKNYSSQSQQGLYRQDLMFDYFYLTTL